jgi:perosamine synthetase
MKKIYLSEPNFNGQEKKYLIECISSGFVSSVGNFVHLFERKISKFTNSNYCVSCINGTSALDISVKLFCKKNRDEVIVPTMTFVATINALRYNNINPIFMDCDDYFNIDENKTINFIKKKTKFINGKTVNKKTGKTISAIIIAHIWGNAASVDKLIPFCRKRNIKIIEDAAESFGSKYKTGKFKGKFTGTIGDVGIFSFNGNKIITAGSGGAIVSNRRNLIKRAKYLITQARDNKFDYIHGDIGHNYRISNLNAAVGLAQLEKVNEKIKKKREIHNFYKKNLSNNPKYSLCSTPKYSNNNIWINILKINSKKISRKILYKKLKTKSIEIRPIWYPIHLLKPYKKYETYMITNANELHKTCVCLPSSPKLSNKDLKKIITNLK